MPLTQKEHGVAQLIADRFYKKRQPFSHIDLLRKLEDPRPILSLSGRSIITSNNSGPKTEYLPTALTYYYAGDQILRDEAKAAVRNVLIALQSLFRKTYTSGIQYRFEEFATQHSNVSPAELSLGLFLIKDIPNTIFTPQMNDQGTMVNSFQINEHILTLDPKTIWDDFIRSRVPSEDAPKGVEVQKSKERAANAKQSAPRVKWQTFESLGEGGQGWAFKARRSGDQSGQIYVLKRLKNKERLKRFQSEVTALARLQHPGILKIIETGEDESGPFFISEYCEGSDLGKTLLSGRDLLFRLQLFRQVCDAIAAAHNAAILHRDLKPSNIFLRNDGSVVVGDFGLCIDLNDARERATQTLEAIGARMYIAPEIEMGRVDEPKASSDVYSLGKVLYFILSTRTLLREDYAEGDFDLRRQAEEPEMHFVYELFDKTLRKNPEERFQTAARLLMLLDSVIERVRHRAHVLNATVRQRCLFCGVGEYQRKEAASYELMFVCNNCGNIQKFTGAPPQKQWWS